MLKIRLQRIGKKNSPSFRVVLVEHTMRPQGEFIELLGSYNKIQKQKNLNKERILYWISKGAQLSPTMHNMLVDEKIIDKSKVKAWKSKKRAEEPAASQPAADKQAGPPQSEGLGGETPSTKVVEETKKEEVAPTPEGVGVPTDVGIDTEPKKE